MKAFIEAGWCDQDCCQDQWVAVLQVASNHRMIYGTFSCLPTRFECLRSNWRQVYLNLNLWALCWQDLILVYECFHFGQWPLIVILRWHGPGLADWHCVRSKVPLCEWWPDGELSTSCWQILILISFDLFMSYRDILKFCQPSEYLHRINILGFSISVNKSKYNISRKYPESIILIIRLDMWQ